MRLFTMACLLSVSLAVFADGEQRFHEEGTVWVDPVEYFELQDINNNDLNRDYDQGDINISSVIKRKGKKVYGLRLKPIAGAMRIKDFLNIGYDDFISGTIDYQNLYGIEGIPLHEAGFCIYVDEGVSRTYNFTYNYKITENAEGGAYTDNGKGTANVSITGLHLVPSDGGIGLSYALNAKVTETERTTGNEDYAGRSTGKQTLTKASGVDEKLGKFIYFNGSGDLLVMLGATAQAVASAASSEDLLPDERQKMTTRPWARIYFLVEQILVDDDGEAIAAPLDSEDKEELKDYVASLTAWLKGEGDDLGLGERTDAKTAAVINVISTVGAVLAGGTLASFVGNTGAQIASNLTESIINAGGSEFPPEESPEWSESDGMEPRRQDEEEEEGRRPDEDPEGGNGEPPADDEPGGFKPTLYPDLCDKYVKIDPYGDITVKDPVTEEEVIYTNNGDDTWRNLNTNQDWTADEIAERLRYKEENKTMLKKDADTAIKNKAEQRAKWDAQNKRDRLRGASDESLAYKKEKEKNDKEYAMSKRMDELAAKYDMVALGDGSNVKAFLEERKKSIQEEQKKESLNAERQMKLDETLGTFEAACSFVDKTCDAILYTMGKIVPGGMYVYDGYALVKGASVAASELGANAMFTDKEIGILDAYCHIQRGLLKGTIAVVQNHAGGIAAKLPGGTTGAVYVAKEFLVFAAPESITSGLNAYEKAKDQGKDFGVADFAKAGLDGFMKKSLAYVTNKGLAFGLSKTGSTVSKLLGKNDALNMNRYSFLGHKFSDSQTSSFSVFKGSSLDKILTKLIQKDGIKPFVDAKGSATFLTKNLGNAGLYSWENDKIQRAFGLKHDDARKMAASAARHIAPPNSK